MDAAVARKKGAGYEITPAFVRQVSGAVCREKRVRRRLEGGGLLHVDRRLPYLVLYRFPGRAPKKSIRDLVASETSYLLFPADEGYHEKLCLLVRGLGEMLSSELGAFLLLEVWPAAGGKRFTIHHPAAIAPSTVETLKADLSGLRVVDPEVEVETQAGERRHPPGYWEILSSEQCRELGILTLGLEFPRLSQNPEAGHPFPLVHREMQRRLSGALRAALFDFIRVQTHCELESVHQLGRRSLGGAARYADRRLAQIEASYPFLLQLLPVNSAEVWERFQASRFEEAPAFHYRLLPVDPDELKRQLYATDLGGIEDYTLAQMLREKREELDIQITMLAERGTPRFLYSSLRLYHGVEPELLGLAERLLTTFPPTAPGRGAPETVDARGFKEAAEAEIEHFRQGYPGISTRIEVKDDLVSLMVSHGNLLIPRNLRIRRDRLEALLQHEVGTHVLTYFNGRAQPLRLLSAGLDDYDELQEGLAVLAEYLVGRLDRARMRLLAARVVAAHCVAEGATFVDTFRELRTRHGFQPRTCFDVALRVHAGGGFIKDVIYLRGLVQLLDYLREGKALEPLYVGKIALKHVPAIEELRARQFLRPIPLLPRFLTSVEGQERLKRLREGLSLASMVA